MDRFAELQQEFSDGWVPERYGLGRIVDAWNRFLWWEEMNNADIRNPYSRVRWEVGALPDLIADESPNTIFHAARVRDWDAVLYFVEEGAEFFGYDEWDNVFKYLTANNVPEDVEDIVRNYYLHTTQ